jgi:hypothetical protein
VSEMVIPERYLQPLDRLQRNGPYDDRFERQILEDLGCAEATLLNAGYKRNDRNGVWVPPVNQWAVKANAAEAKVAELEGKLNAPELISFREGVVLEAAHQRERWGSEHDDGKTPADWFWLVGYLAGKALAAHISGNTEKALHHTISTAAALANWHAAILGKTGMRPGIMKPAGFTEQP